MGVKSFLSFVFVLFVILSLLFYWFIPVNTMEFSEFGAKNFNSNFSVGEYQKNMQFYENMRYSDSEISYRVYNCPLQKKYNMERAIEIISNLSILRF